MTTTVKVTEERELKLSKLRLSAGARYWEDATVNGVEDKEGTLIPFREGDYWCPTIDIDSGTIENWPKGMTASIHYKVCDDGEYWLISEDGKEYKYPQYYVPKILDITKEGFGDYIIMNVDENGKIANWPEKHNVEDFFVSEDD